MKKRARDEEWLIVSTGEGEDCWTFAVARIFVPGDEEPWGVKIELSGLTRRGQRYDERIALGQLAESATNLSAAIQSHLGKTEPPKPKLLVEEGPKVQVDDIATRKLNQRSRDQWGYEIVSRRGIKFTVTFAVQPYGLVKEALVVHGELNEAPGQRLIWEREYEVGSAPAKTWLQRIQYGS